MRFVGITNPAWLKAIANHRRRAWEMFPNLLYAERWFIAMHKLGAFRAAPDGD